MTPKTSSSKSLRLLLHFGEVVGFDEVLDELFRFGLGEAKEGDNVEPVFFGNGAVVVVVLGETVDLVHLFFGGGSDCGTHLFNICDCTII